MSDWPSMQLSAVSLDGNGFDRRSELRRAGWEAISRLPRRILLLDSAGQVPFADQGQSPALKFGPAPEEPQPADIFLGVAADGTAVVLRMLGDEQVLKGEQVPEGEQAAKGEWGGLREIGGRLSDWERELMMEALALANWHRSHTHCPRCGSPTRVEGLGWWRTCPEDSSEHFPRTDPAIITAVLDEAGNVLVARHARWPRGAFSTLAGFVEPGEPAESALRREVGEEVGLTVTEVRYLGSQPWPFPGSLMLGFHAQVAGDRPEARVDGEEIVEARWLSRSELPTVCAGGEVRLPGRLSIAHRLLRTWFGEEIPEQWCRW